MKKNLTLLLIVAFMISSPVWANVNIRQGNIEILNPWVQATNEKNADLFMKIVNHGSEPDKLTSVQSNVSQLNELHLHSEDNGKMTMHKIGFIEIPGFGNKVMVPRGHHIMLSHLSHPLREGDNVYITLHFEREGDISFLAPIRR